MKTLDLPSQEYIRQVTRWSQPLPEVKPQESAKPHPLKGKPKASTITPAEVHEMRRLKMSGMLNKEIAAKMGRSYTAVQVIVTDLTKATRNESDQKRHKGRFTLLTRYDYPYLRVAPAPVFLISQHFHSQIFLCFK